MVVDTTDTALLTRALDKAGIDRESVRLDRDRVLVVFTDMTARHMTKLVTALPGALRVVFGTRETTDAHDILDTWKPANHLTVIASDSFYHEVLATGGTGLPTGFRRTSLRIRDVLIDVWFQTYDTPRPVPASDDSFEFDVAISFAGADRDVAQEINDVIAGAGYRVFYDYHHQSDLLGEDLAELLQDVYFRRSRYAVVVLSKAFTESAWAGNWEWKAVLARMRAQPESYVLPYVLDDAVIPGLNPTIGYVSRAQHSPREFGRLVVRKLGDGTGLSG